MTPTEIAIALVTGIWPTRPDASIRDIVARVACGWVS